MGWANPYIRQLQEGKTVQFRPRGNSMRGKIESGQLVTVQPISGDLEPGDIVLCKVNGNQYLHLVKAIDSKGRYLIGNNRGTTNGWTSRDNIYGKVTEVED